MHAECGNKYTKNKIHLNKERKERERDWKNTYGGLLQWDGKDQDERRRRKERRRGEVGGEPCHLATRWVWIPLKDPPLLLFTSL